MADDPALAAYSRGEMTALELRRRLDGATYGEVLRALGEQDSRCRGRPPPAAKPAWSRPVPGCSRTMARDLKLFVVGTGPLITVAAAQSLDYLTYVEADLVGGASPSSRRT